MATRRQILSWSLTSAACLSGGLVSYQWLQEEDYQQLENNFKEFHFLTQEDTILLAGIIPAVIGEESLQQWRSLNLSAFDLISKIDTTLRFTSQLTRDGLRELFDLLWSRFGKLLLAGIWSTWSTATVADVDEFLHGWRSSWVGELNDGYLGLQQLIVGALFTESGLWSSLGYDGPPW